MKKYVIFLLSVLLALGTFTIVSADDGGMDSVRSAMPGAKVIIGGDARVRGVWKKNYDLDSDPDTDLRGYDQRVRIKVDGHAGSGIEARTRLEAASGEWDGTANTRGVMVDYMYLHVPISTVNVDAGLKKRSFGNKFFLWDARRETVELYTSFGATTVGAYTDKADESDTVRFALDSGGANTEPANTGDENLEDYNAYGIYAVHNLAAMQIGAHIIFDKDDSGTDMDGTQFDVYVNGNFGNIGIAGEFAYQGGDKNETTIGTDTENKTGGFVQASMNMGQIDVAGAFAYATGGYSADSHFTPTTFLGTDNPTAIADFMSATDNKDNTTYAIVGQGTYNVSDALSVLGRVAYCKLENLGSELGGADTGDESAWEIDAGVGYKIADNAKYMVDFGYLKPSDITTDDDAAIALAHKVEVYF